MKPVASIGWFVESQEDLSMMESCHVWGTPVMLSMYVKAHVDLAKECMPYSSIVSSLHLPKGLSTFDFDSGGLIDELLSFFPVKRMVIHPHSVDYLDEIVKKVVDRKQFCLNLETFGLSKRLHLFELIERYGRLIKESEFVGLCFDFSHFEEGVISYPLLKGLNQYIKMVHLSEIVDGKGHQPIRFGNQETGGPVPQQGIFSNYMALPNLAVEEIALEYAKEWAMGNTGGKLIKHHSWLTQYVEGKRRRYERKI